jgi:serine/threonine protein kinase
MVLASDARFGPYEILATLGAGGTGEVYKARDSRLDRIVAVRCQPNDSALALSGRRAPSPLSIILTSVPFTTSGRTFLSWSTWTAGPCP